MNSSPISAHHQIRSFADVGVLDMSARNTVNLREFWQKYADAHQIDNSVDAMWTTLLAKLKSKVDNTIEHQ